VKICQACKTTWGDGDTPDYCPTCLTPITDWHGLYLGMDELCRQQQQRASTAEQRLREVEAALWELVKLKDAKERVEELSARMMTGAEMAEIKRLNKYYKTDKEPAWEAARAALSPERTEEGKEKNYTPDEVIDVLEHAFIPVDYKKKMALFELIDALKRPDEPAAAQELPVPIQSPGRDGAASSMPLVTQYPASAAAPSSPLLPGLERASLTHNPTHGAALWLGKRLVARIAGGAEVSAVTESDPIPQWRKDAETFVNAVNSASSPLLGLELAQEMLEDAEVTNDISESEADAFGADDSAVYHRAARKELAKVGQAISAEISRLRGEGSAP